MPHGRPKSTAALTFRCVVRWRLVAAPLLGIVRSQQRRLKAACDAAGPGAVSRRRHDGCRQANRQGGSQM